MTGMFAGCYFLKFLDILNFNTNNVKNMSYMLYECTSLEEIIISNFNTKNVDDMSYLFINSFK